jgi:hypothetical protein
MKSISCKFIVFNNLSKFNEIKFYFLKEIFFIYLSFETIRKHSGIFSVRTTLIVNDHKNIKCRKKAPANYFKKSS